MEINRDAISPEKDTAMFEVAMNPEARKAIQKAHVERARAVKAAFDWLFSSRNAR